MYLSEKDVMIELDEVKNAPYITEMHILKVHMAKWVITKIGFQCLQLHQIVSCNEPFHNQWNRGENGSEPCGPFNLPKIFQPSESCTKCFEGEIGCGWR